MSASFDVVVVGGGPAGATAGGLLAADGHRVCIIEREHFPRFHIGESLLPAELPIFERLGFDMSGLSALPKRGADFLDERTGQRARFDFADGLPGGPKHAWQVERATFDHALIRCAEAHGAEVRFGVTAVSVEADASSARVRTSEGDLDARFAVDATGRDRLLSKQNRSYERIDGFGRAAVGTHFDHIAEAAAEELAVTGNITVLMLPDQAWGWAIPLPGRRLSAGFVSARNGVVSEAWFEACYAASPFLQRMTAGATRGPLRRTGDYSYRNPTPHGVRWGCVGDASYFLDPVFSSGVTVAMAGGECLADLLGPALREGREDDPELLTPLEAHMKRPYDVFGAVVWSFYHTNFVHNLFFYDDPDPALHAGLTSVLAGDVWRDDNLFQKMILRRRSRSRAGKPRSDVALAASPKRD